MARIDIKGTIIPDDYAYVYDYFGWPCAYAGNVKKIVNAAKDTEPIEVYINSGGGSVNAGKEIYSILLDVEQRVTVKVQSLAGSAASLIATAGKCEMYPGAMMMLHRVSGSFSGNAEDIKEALALLEANDRAIAEIYNRKCGKNEAEILDIMCKSTWLTASECIKLGLADRMAYPGGDTEGGILAASVDGLLSPVEIDRLKGKIAAEQTAKANLTILELEAAKWE